MTAIDWSTVPMTDAASASEQAIRLPVIVIPRAVFEAYHPLPWHDVEVAAFSGIDGLAPLIIAAAVDQPDTDLAFVRAANARDRSLQRRILLYRQGW